MQSVQRGLPALGWKVCAGQSMQPVLPRESWKRPEAQSEQPLVLAVRLNWPLWHAWHCPGLAAPQPAWNWPAAQW